MESRFQIKGGCTKINIHILFFINIDYMTSDLINNYASGMDAGYGVGRGTVHQYCVP